MITPYPETGGDAAKALKVVDSAVPEWEAKNNTRAKARQPLLKLKRNVDGEPATPITRELQLMAKPFIRHKVASTLYPTGKTERLGSISLVVVDNVVCC